MSIAAPPHLLASTPASHLVHASDADQAEALLTRCGLGKLGSERLTYQKIFSIHHFAPIRSTLGYSHIRQANQAGAINEVVSALKLEQHGTANGEDAPLRVVNGMCTQGSSMITVAARGECMPLLPFKAFLAVLETLLFDGEVVSWLIPNTSLRISPPLSSPRTFLRYPSLKGSSHYPWQRN